MVMRHKGIGIILLIAIFASLGGVAYKVAEHFWLMKAREIKKNPTKLLDYVPEAALQIKDFRRSKIEGGQKVWELSGEEASYLKADKEVTIKKPRMTFYQKDNNAIEAIGNDGHLWLSGQGGEMEKAQFQGGVQVNYRGFVLKTEEILYLKSKNQVLLPGKVTVKGDSLELEGIGMEINLDDEKMRMLSKVRTRLEPERMVTKRARADGQKKNKL
ncbi:MAG: LPS export ABC transporter periplasmic protein LptC [Deltaproteobacteria bacterium RIFCSPLOWO2_12_55_13]|nr:MAG: LPS export ABC transporter periplasmic protein LptC [Deltaproteobacteria bacterium RIFCSPLOWO2_12_55_13]